MKKAIGYVHKGDIFAALKIPFGLSLTAVEYPSKNGKVKITLEGDRLPFEESKGNRIPEINYEFQGTWHQARITAVPQKKEPEPEPEPIKPVQEVKEVILEPEIKLEEEPKQHGKKRKYTKKETRVFKFEKLNIEERADGLGPRISGYAAVFNSWSEDLGGFREQIKRGAFAKAIGKSDVRGLFNHDSNYVLGRQSNGTLELKEDKNGLWMSIDPPDTQIIRDLVLAPIRRGDIKEQSFAFIIAEGGDEWKNLHGEKPDEPTTRTITEVDELFDVSPVTYPAYPDTSVALRSMNKAKETVFKPATETDVLSISYRDLMDAKEPEDTQTAAAKMIDILMPKLTDEQREKYVVTKEILSAKPDGEPLDAVANIEDDPSDEVVVAEDRSQELDKRIAKVLRG